jgi:hypothetical protein
LEICENREVGTKKTRGCEAMTGKKCVCPDMDSTRTRKDTQANVSLMFSPSEHKKPIFPDGSGNAIERDLCFRKRGKSWY